MGNILLRNIIGRVGGLISGILPAFFAKVRPVPIRTGM
jgi:hypothetical protein